MKVLLVNGSPNPNGYTSSALKIVKSTLEKRKIETSWFQLNNKPVHGCIDCRHCLKTNRCIFKDDQCNELIELIMSSNAIIIGSPVYFASPNGALCALLDRVFYSTCTLSQLFKGKVAAALVTCGSVGGTSALDRLYRYFIPSQMTIITSSDYLSIQDNCIKDRNKRTIELLETLGNNMVDFLLKKK